MKRHNSCLNTLAIIEYIRRYNRHPELLLNGLESELTGVTDPLAFLSDPNNWVSSEVVRCMFQSARQITGHQRVAYDIGFESVTRRELGYVQRILIQTLGSPKKALGKLKTLNEKFNRNKEIEVVEIKRTSAIVRLKWDRSLMLSNDFCLFNQGIYSAMSTTWNQQAGDVEEVKCQFEGDEYCEFHISWKEMSLVRRLRSLLTGKTKLFREILDELEHDKQLLNTKYDEVRTLNVRLQTRVDQLLAIQQTSQEILSGINYTEVFPTILNYFIAATGFSRGMIMLIDEETEMLKYEYGVGEDSKYLDILEGYEVPLSRKENILARTALSGEAVITLSSDDLKLNPENPIISIFNPKAFVILPLTTKGKVVGLLAADHTDSMATMPSPDSEFLDGFANQVALALENVRMLNQVREASLTTIHALASAMEAKDAYTRGHSERVANLSAHLANEIGLPMKEVEAIRDMCLLHDIGKIGISGTILNKKGALTKAELVSIHNHPAIGEKIITKLKPEGDEAAIIRHHHERYDGKGYPDGLKGEENPLSVRIVTICDTFDAMIYDRPYRRAISLDASLSELEKKAGSQFDPQLVEVFIGLVKTKGTAKLVVWPEKD